MARELKLPKRLQPVLATLIDAPFDDAGWVFETKWDGFRMVACIEAGKVTLYSRNGKIVSDNYMPVAKALEKIGHDAVIDGELVALDARGISRFQLLQNALRSTANLRYCVFDAMFLDGKDLRGLPLVERKERLRRILPKHPLLAYSEHRWEHGTKFFKEAQKKGLEGIMAKRAQSRYLSGARSKDWLKIKTAKRQEVVIAGFTKPRRSRQYFGSLAIAVREGKGWRYVGHVGTGFSQASLKEIHGQAVAAAHGFISFHASREGRSHDHLGEAQARRRGQVRRVDHCRRNASSGVSRVAGGQEPGASGHGERGASLTRGIHVPNALVLLALGLLWPIIGKLGLGRLHGDIVIERENFRLYIPRATSLRLKIRCL